MISGVQPMAFSGADAGLIGENGEKMRRLLALPDALSSWGGRQSGVRRSRTGFCFAYAMTRWNWEFSGSEALSMWMRSTR